MNSFEISKKIHSCNVTKQMLTLTEKYITEDLVKSLNLNVQILDYSINLRDSEGEEKFQNIKDYGFNKFENSIKEIRIKFSYYSSSIILNISILFDPKYISGSKIKVNLSTENPREKCIGIYSQLNRIINNDYNNNWIFNAHSAIESLLIGINIFSVSIIIGLVIDKKYNKYFYLCASLILISLFYLISKYIYPYFEFETEKIQKIRELRKWVALGFISFIIFGTIFTFFRKKIFGF